MNRLFLLQNPDLFQGEKYLNKEKNYFEGWYFKNTNGVDGISFIPGINMNGKDKKAFIQVITGKKSYYINYNINDFKFSYNPFYIIIEKNYFSKSKLHIDIKDMFQNINIYGDIKYSNSKNINTTKLNPNIMGPFSYIPFMECNHAILCMKNKIDGSININDNKIDFNNGIGYIEKDWGCSFPRSYIWCEGNNFKNPTASFMISIADIPFKLFNFKGFICSFIMNNEEFRFSTYNNSKIVKCNIDDNLLDITLQKGLYSLNIKSKYNKGLKLIAPVKGKMNKYILESINSKITLLLTKNNKIIFEEISINCGLEIVK